jgi:hypothetical protein
MPSRTTAELKIIAASCADKIRSALEDVSFFRAPYKHIVIDDFLPRELAVDCMNSFPPTSDPIWEHANDLDIEVKYRTTWASEFDIPENIVDAVRVFNSSTMLRAMADRIEIPKLVPDAYFTGGGLNVSKRGGLLDVHIDGNYHDATGLNRRLNLLLYLNDPWRDEWGGEFGIYDVSGTKCVKKITPIFNRLVIFDSHDRSFHGLPEPISCPPDVERKSIILYYYTVAPRPDEQVTTAAPHSALWVKRNLLDKRGGKTRPYT